MIIFDIQALYHDGINDLAIFFDKSDKSKIIKVLERGLNTLSPPDHDLIKLLEDMKK